MKTIYIYFLNFDLVEIGGKEMELIRFTKRSENSLKYVTNAF